MKSALFGLLTCCSRHNARWPAGINCTAWALHHSATRSRHEYASYDVDFRVFHCRLKDPDQLVSHARVNDHRWVDLAEMSEYKFPDADAKTLAKLLDLED